jgi:amino acid transporter
VCLPTKQVSWFNIWASALGTVVLIVATILLPIKAAPNLNSAKDIFTSVYNQTGWPTGWAFCQAMLAPIWTISGYDVAAHVAEETHDPARNVPRAMIWSTWASLLLGFFYLVSLSLCATDIDGLLADPLGQPLGALIGQALGPSAGVVLLAINFVCNTACGVAFVSIFPSKYSQSQPFGQFSALTCVPCCTVRRSLAYLFRLQSR